MGAIAVHLVVAPHAFVFVAIGPDVGAAAVEFIVFKKTDVACTATSGKMTVAGPFAISEVSMVYDTVWQSLMALAMLFVVCPHSRIVFAISELVLALTMCDTINPVTLVVITFSMNESALAISLVVAPEAHILASTWPKMNATPLSLSRLGSLAVINRT